MRNRKETGRDRCDKRTNDSCLKKIVTADPFTIPKEIYNNYLNMMMCSSVFVVIQRKSFVPTVYLETTHG